MKNDEAREALHLGVYTPSRVGALAGATGYQIGQWARHGLITPTVYEGRPRNLYSYGDVAEAIVVRWLLDHEEISHKDIRRALDDVCEEFPDWPLLSAPLGIGRLSVDDAHRLVRERERGAYVEIGKNPDQIIIKPQLLELARDVLRRGGWLARELELNRIEVTPLKLGGQPTLRGRRWSIDQVARLAADDAGRDVLITSYGLEPAEVDEAVAWTSAAALLG